MDLVCIIRFQTVPAKRWGGKKIVLYKGNGEGRNRTADAEIFSLSLYRLSYLA